MEQGDATERAAVQPDLSRAVDQGDLFRVRVCVGFERGLMSSRCV